MSDPQAATLTRLRNIQARTGKTIAERLAALHAGAKAQLRLLHEQVMQAVAALGPCELAPRKTCISLCRKKQFAMLGPATKDRIELGLNARSLPPHPRLKAMPPGGMCPYTVRLGAADEVDDTLVGWLRAACEAAG